MGKRLVLLGDSIFDNGAYVGAGEADVAAQVRRRLPDWSIDMRARDGAKAHDILAQLEDRPVEKPCWFALSIGGNNALGYIDLLADPQSYPATAMWDRLAAVKDEFRAAYREALYHVIARGQPALVCTIYNPNMEDAALQRRAETALSLFNDVIVEEALRHRLPIVDLRQVCTAPEHFANPIEPSAAGGARIAEAIAAVVTG